MLAYESSTTRLPNSELHSCPVVEDLLPLYIENELSPTTRDVVASHLAGCPHCTGYLAGAQSARTQLRSDGAARSAVLQNDAPQQKTVRRGQSLFRAFLGLSLGFLQIVVSGAIWASLDPWIFNIGPLLSLVVFAALVILTPRSRFDLVRWLVAAASAVAAGVGTGSILSFSGPADVRFFAMLLLMSSLLGVRYFLWDRD